MDKQYRSPNAWSKLRGSTLNQITEKHAPMNKVFRMSCCALLAAASLAAQAQSPQAPSKEEARLLVAAQVLDTLRGQPDQQIPQHLLQRAYGVAVIPDVTKLALLLGGRRGSGVMTVRDSRGRFGNPIFGKVTGVSLGLQWGAQQTDIVLVFTTKRGVEGIADGKLTLGVGASVAAGPVGRQAEAAAGTHDAEVYAYSRSRGLFLGVALDGTSISIDEKSNRAFYGRKDVLASDIISGAATAPDSENSRRFLAALAASTGETADSSAGNASNAQVAPAPIQPAAGETGAQPATGSGEVQTFPMADPHPGAEPPK
jgi:lipid-binding SYLF domain-containing protein